MAYSNLRRSDYLLNTLRALKFTSMSATDTTTNLAFQELINFDFKIKFKNPVIIILDATLSSPTINQDITTIRIKLDGVIKTPVGVFENNAFIGSLPIIIHVTEELQGGDHNVTIEYNNNGPTQSTAQATLYIGSQALVNK